MKILITGGCGFIGANAAARYIGRGDELIVLDDLSRRGTGANLTGLRELGEFEFIKLDIRNGDAVDDAFSRLKELDIILHLAAQVAVTTSVEDPRTDFEINALGTFNLLEAARKYHPRAAFIFSSTNKVYGSLEGLKVEEGDSRYLFAGDIEAVGEEENLDFYSPYGCSKGAADQYVRDYARIFGLDTVVLRQSCIYGPRQFGIEDQGWVAWFLIAGMLKKPLAIYGNGKQVRDILFVEDLLDCFDAATGKIDDVRGKVFNIGGGPGNTVSLLEFVKLANESLGTGLKPEFKDWRPGDQPIYVSDISKAERELGWRPRTGIEEGIRRLHEWILENRQVVAKVLE